MMATATEQNTAIETVTVTVDGKDTRLPKGKNLLAALLDSGTYIPHYCWHPSLAIDGNCRLCVVEIEGQPRPGISCNMTCTDGLRIKTEGTMVEESRKGMMEFLLVNHPLDCPVCDRGGECMLQRYSMEYGTGTARTTEERRRFEKPQFDPLIDIERNRCIMCTRCVRFMDEIADEHLLAVFGRGDRNYIGTFGSGPVSNIFSGNIVDICPVGCLTSKPFRFKARAWELQQVVSTCTLCSAGCPTTAWLRDGILHRMTPPVRKYNGQYTIDEDTTEFICNEGRFGNYYANSPDRLKNVLRRVDGELKAATWDEGLEAAVEALRSSAEAGPDKVAILAGGRATNEEFHLLSRLARSALGTNQIDWRLGFVSSSAATAAGEAFAASDGDLAKLEEKEYAATLVINAELFESTPVIGLKIKEAARHEQTSLAILGSRVDGWLSRHATTTLVTSPDELASTVSGLAAAIASGDPASSEMAAMLAGSSTGLIVLGLDTAGGALNDALVGPTLELLARLGSGWEFLPVAQARNAKGAFACGAQSDRLPGGEPLDSESARQRLCELWGELKAEAQPGPTAPDILRRAARGEIETLLLHRADELVNHPQRALIERALDSTPNVIVIDVFPSWITERASVVLPGALFFETEGSLVAADGTLQCLTRGNRPPGDAQADWRIIATLIESLSEEARYPRIENVFDELVSCWSPPTRFRLRDLRTEGPGRESPQRPQSIIRRRERPSFKVHFSARPEPSEPTPPASMPAAPGKLRLLWHNAIQGADHLGSRSTEFDRLRPERSIELNPADANELGLTEGSRVRIGGCRNEAVVMLNDSLPAGLAFGAANVLGLELAEDAAGLPEIELTLVEEGSS